MEKFAKTVHLKEGGQIQERITGEFGVGWSMVGDI